MIKRFSPIPSTDSLSVTGDRGEKEDGMLHPEDGDEGKTSLTADAAVR